MGTIAHLSSVHDPFDIRIFHKECHSLAQAGYVVTVIAPHMRSEVVDGIKIEGVPRARWRLLRITNTTRKVWWRAFWLDADLYHFHDPELIPAGLLLRAWGKKVIYDVHEDVPRDMLAKEYLPLWQRRPLARVFEVLENSASRFFSALITVTPDIAKRFQHQPRTILVRNFPRVDEFPSVPKLPWRERLPAIAYVGSIAADRGIREMVQAMGNLPGSLPGRLLLATNSFPPLLRQRAAAQRGWDRVEDRGHLDHQGIFDLLGQVRGGLVCFHPVPNNLTALPHKLFEYMAAGIPVIASDFPTWREIVARHRCGLLVNPMEPPAIAGAIEYLLTHPQEAELMGKRGRQAVEEHYNWTAEEQSLLQLYGRLLDRPCVA